MPGWLSASRTIAFAAGLASLGSEASAETALPSYRDDLVRQEWRAVDDLLEAGLHAEAAERAIAFQDRVVRDGTLEYLVGLSWRLRHDDYRAEMHYRAALELNPRLQEAWNDLGEIALSDARFDEAERAFKEVSSLVPAGPFAWLGPQRLAEIAAHRHDPIRFEQHMHEALRRGFTFRSVDGLPNWRTFYADPALHDSVEKLVTVYGDERTLGSFRPAPVP
jgi:tetratricopeptide (TPR) repeat protein